jgi:FkbM family methyltransferase
MTIYQTAKEGLIIAKKFGVKHAFARFKDYLMIKNHNRKSSKLYKKTKQQKSVIKNIMGNKMQLNMDDNGIHMELFLNGLREPAATKHLMEILSRDDVVLEVGANIGYYALIESKLCKKIYAVEPVADNISNLKKNIKLNNYNNIEVYQMAFGENQCEKSIYISQKSNWHSFYKTNNFIKQEKIKMDKIDNFLNNREMPTFIRMDVEGYELAVIKGMEKTLPKIKKMFIEIHSDVMSAKETEELLNILKKENFHPELIIKYDKPGLNKILPNNHIDKIYNGDKGNYEIFFTK